MEIRWNTFGFCLSIYIFLISMWGIRECWSLNDEGRALLAFRARITFDPYNALVNWNPNDCNPCKWWGVYCVEGQVRMLELKELSLEGTLAPELGKLSHLNYLVLCKNNFSGAIPKELGDLPILELIDLRENNLSGSIPSEIGKMSSLKDLLLCDNKIEGGDPQDGRKFKFPSKSLLVENCSSQVTTLFACINRKFGHCVWQSNFKHWNISDSLIILAKTTLMKYFNAFALPLLGKPAPDSYEEDYCDLSPSSNVPEIDHNASELDNSARRKLLQSSASNLAAAPFSGGPTIEFSSVPTTYSSGSFPAVPDANKKQNQSPTLSHPPSPSNSPHDASDENQTNPHVTNGDSKKLWKYIIVVLVVLLAILIIILLYISRKRAAKVIRPWKSGISGQLRKAFITGVPKLNREELETACEDFSNIISCCFKGCTIYKGTLSSGVEIAVVSTLIKSAKDWTKNMELKYRKKIDTLSRINHKNFVNLIGYCEEEEPFTRMYVFEYAPSGNVFEHLHVEEMERLGWSERLRIIMGVAYCLQYMHDLNPPVAHTCNVSSTMILLTDDFAAKIAELIFSSIVAEDKITGDSRKPEVRSQEELENNVYDFGRLLLEIISGKLLYSEEQGDIVNWANKYLNDEKSIKNMVDPTLESFKENELNVICDVAYECIQSPKSRPAMRDVTSKLREGLDIPPEQAIPRLSPLWWAELEILSEEAT